MSSTKMKSALERFKTQRLRLVSRRLPPPAERRAIRLRAGMPFSEAARALGVSRQCLHCWEAEAGGFHPVGQNLVRYREFLDELVKIAREIEEAEAQAQQVGSGAALNVV